MHGNAQFQSKKKNKSCLENRKLASMNQRWNCWYLRHRFLFLFLSLKKKCLPSIWTFASSALKIKKLCAYFLLTNSWQQPTPCNLKYRAPSQLKKRIKIMVTFWLHAVLTSAILCAVDMVPSLFVLSFSPSLHLYAHASNKLY